MIVIMSMMMMVITSLPLGRARFGVAARDELSPTPGRELGLGDLDLGDLGLGDESAWFLRGDGVSPSLVQSLSLIMSMIMIIVMLIMLMLRIIMTLITMTIPTLCLRGRGHE